MSPKSPEGRRQRLSTTKLVRTPSTGRARSRLTNSGPLGSAACSALDDEVALDKHRTPERQAQVDAEAEAAMAAYADDDDFLTTNVGLFAFACI